MALGGRKRISKRGEVNLWRMHERLLLVWNVFFCLLPFGMSVSYSSSLGEWKGSTQVLSCGWVPRLVVLVDPEE